MPCEKSSPDPRIASGRKRWSCLPSCFVGSLPDRPVPSAGGPKPRISWFSWSRYRKKKKTVPLDGARPSTKASAQKNSPSEGRTGRSRSNARQLQRDPVSDLHAGGDSQQPRLPRIPTRHNTLGEPAPASLNADPVRSGSSTSHPCSPAHIHPATSHTSPVRTGRVGPTAGIWVMVATLAVMVLLGPASAVVCLCSSLYLVALLGVGKDDDRGSKNGVASREDDMNSVEYKKRVILEGLLERNGRKPTGFLVAPAQAGGKR